MEIESPKLRKWMSVLLLTASIAASLAGILAFILLFVPDYNIYWLILTPVILAIYQIPAAMLFRLYRRLKSPPASEEDGDQPH